MKGKSLVFLVLFMICPLEGPAQDLGETVITIRDRSGQVAVVTTELEADELLNDLLKAIDPRKAENSYMTLFMKEKLLWLYSEAAGKKLEIIALPGFSQNSDGTDDTATLMRTSYDPKRGINYILIYLARFVSYVRVQEKVPVGFNQMIKNLFTFSMVHEATHLEQPPSYYETPYEYQTILNEEIRAWYTVNMGAVRELRQKGQPIQYDLLVADDILNRCKNNPWCQEFKDFITKKTPKPK